MSLFKTTEIKLWILLNERVRREPIGEAPNKKNSIGVSRVNASIPFQIKPWEYEEMKNSDEKINIGGIPRGKKAVFRGEGLLTYTWIISETGIVQPNVILYYIFIFINWLINVFIFIRLCFTFYIVYIILE